MPTHQATATVTFRVSAPVSRTGSYLDADTLDEAAIAAIEAECERLSDVLGLEITLDARTVRTEACEGQ